MGIKLGCIADDFTGASDLANNLVRAGMRVTQVIGIPNEWDASNQTNEQPEYGDAVVVSLKSRTIPVGDAIAQSLAALRWLQKQGAQQIYFKYCSTFDSTAQGNIGPVTEALMQALGTDFTIATPAFPDNGRTVFKGYLFVGDGLLSESGMQNHPLTPMNDANLVRVLQQQCVGKVGLTDYKVIGCGPKAINDSFAAHRVNGISIAIIDALSNQDLLSLGASLKGMPLVTAGSGVAIGLPQNFGISASLAASALPQALGHQAIVSGSCSLASNAQVKHFIDQGLPSLAIDPLAANPLNAAPEGAALAWARATLADMTAGLKAHSPILVYSTAHPDQIKQIQSKFGVQQASELMEKTLAAVAKGLVDSGVKQLIIAGGETSGACVQALGITQLQIGPQIDPGVVWSFAPQGLHISLKSGNFGTTDFFSKAFKQLVC